MFFEIMCMRKLVFFAVFFISFCSLKDVKAQLPIWFDGAIGIAIPSGGKHFNVQKTHFPGPSFYFLGQTAWNNNWFGLDSLILGGELSTHYINAYNNLDEQDIRLNSLFVNLSRYFSIKDYQPFCNVSAGLSTMNSSAGNFVISMGGAIRGGVYLKKQKFSPGISLGYNAPWIAYRNTLTGFWEISLHLRTLSGFKFPKKQLQKPSYSSE